MASLWPATVALIPFLAAGLGITLCLPTFAGAGVLRRLAFAYLFGIAWIGSLLLASSHLLGLTLGAPLVWIVAGAPVLAGLAVWIRRRAGIRPGRRHLDRYRRRPFLAVAWVTVAAVAGFVSSAILANALTHPVNDWDGRIVWCAQARFIRAAGTVDAPALTSPQWFISHPRYPLLLPLCQVAALDVANTDDERTFRPLYAAFFPVLLVLVATGCKRWAGSRAALAAVLATLSVPFLAFARDGGAAGAYSDLPLACLAGGSLLLLVRARLRLSDGLAGGLLLAAAALSKNEGIIEALAILAIAGWLALSAWRKRSRRRRERASATLAAAGVLVLAVLLLASWRSSIPNRNDEDYAQSLSWAGLPTRLADTQLLLAVPEMARQMFDRENWGYFWWLAPVVLLAGLPRSRRPPVGALVLAATIPLIVAWAAYTLQPAADYYARVTWNRLLEQASVPGFIVLGIALRGLFGSLASLSTPGSPPP